MTGKNRSWEPLNKGFTHGFVLEFENQEDLDYYLTQEPVHLEFSKKAGPLMYRPTPCLDLVDGANTATAKIPVSLTSKMAFYLAPQQHDHSAKANIKDLAIVVESIGRPS